MIYNLPSEVNFNQKQFLAFVKENNIDFTAFTLAKLCNTFKIISPMVFKFSPEAEIRLQIEKQNCVLTIECDMLETPDVRGFCEAFSVAKSFTVERTKDGNMLFTLQIEI